MDWKFNILEMEVEFKSVLCCRDFVSCKNIFELLYFEFLNGVGCL